MIGYSSLRLRTTSGCITGRSAQLSDPDPRARREMRRLPNEAVGEEDGARGFRAADEQGFAHCGGSCFYYADYFPPAKRNSRRS